MIRRPVGRPPRGRSSADVRITIRLTEAEHAALVKRAGDLPLGEWIRRQLKVKP